MVIYEQIVIPKWLYNLNVQSSDNNKIFIWNYNIHQQKNMNPWHLIKIFNLLPLYIVLARKWFHLFKDLCHLYSKDLYDFAITESSGLYQQKTAPSVILGHHQKWKFYQSRNFSIFKVNGNQMAPDEECIGDATSLLSQAVIIFTSYHICMRPCIIMVEHNSFAICQFRSFCFDCFLWFFGW